MFSARCSTVKGEKKLRTRINFHTSHIAKLIPIAGGNRQQSKGTQNSAERMLLDLGLCGKGNWISSFTMAAGDVVQLSGYRAQQLLWLPGSIAPSCLCTFVRLGSCKTILLSLCQTDSQTSRGRGDAMPLFCSWGNLKWNWRPKAQMAHTVCTLSQGQHQNMVQYRNFRQQ